MAPITIRYWAAARTAAGVAEETVEAESCAEALTLAASRREGVEAFGTVMAAASFLVDGVRRDRSALTEIRGPVVLEVLPPFAGG